MTIKPMVLFSLSGKIMPGKKIDLNMKSPLFIITIIVILLLSSTLVIAIGGNNNNNNIGTIVSAGNGTSEIYVSVASDKYPEYLFTKDIGGGQKINFDMPGTSFNFTENETINMTVSLINHQNKAMDYNILVYQIRNDTVNDTLIIAPLNISHVDTMSDRSVGWCHIQIQPGADINSTLGVMLTDARSDETFLNGTEFIANVFPA